MTYTTNYNLNIVEGTDIVNPLTQLNPNFSAIDGIMKDNADAAVTPATCIKSGTVHTVTRTNTDAEMFVFTATGDWNLGDTMTVDGTPVTPVLPDGTGLLTGSYLINSEVLASIKGTKVTIYSNKFNMPIITGNDVEYSSGVSVTDKLNAITTSTELLYELNLPTTVASYSANWQDYYFISIEATFYANVQEQILVPTSWFGTTNSGMRVLIHETTGDNTWEIYQNGNGNINIKSEYAKPYNGLRIHGIMRK